MFRKFCSKFTVQRRNNINVYKEMITETEQKNKQKQIAKIRSFNAENVAAPI